MSSSASRRFRQANNTVANSITVTARVGGCVVQNFEMPAEAPVPVFQYIQQAIGALRVATEGKQSLVLGVVPKWKAWIIRHVLRAV